MEMLKVVMMVERNLQPHVGQGHEEIKVIRRDVEKHVASENKQINK